MNLLDELLKKAMNANRAPVQSDVPGGLLALLTQGNQNTGSQVDINSFLHQNVQPATVPAAPQMQHGSGLGKEVVSSLLGEWFDERKYKNDLERAEKERQAQAAEIEQISKSGLSGKELYFELLKARSKSAQDIAKKGLEPLDPEKTKVVEIGVEGNPKLRQQAIVDPINKSVIPIGPYWQPSSGVTVNTGDLNNIIKDTEAGNIVDSQGNAVKIPIGMTRQQAAEKGYNYGKPPTQAEVKADTSATTVDTLLSNIQTLRKNGASVSGIKGAIQNLRSGNDPLGVVTNEVLNKADVKIDPKNADLMANVKNFGNVALQIMRGAQVGPSEQELFQKSLPTEGQPDEVFDANLRLAEKIFRDAMAKTSQASGRGSPKTPTLDLPPPTPGMEMGGFVFIGGDPAKQENWRPK